LCHANLSLRNFKLHLFCLTFSESEWKLIPLGLTLHFHSLLSVCSSIRDFINRVSVNTTFFSFPTLLIASSVRSEFAHNAQKPLSWKLLRELINLSLKCT
jgi:hypothetical protein